MRAICHVLLVGSLLACGGEDFGTSSDFGGGGGAGGGGGGGGGEVGGGEWGATPGGAQDIGYAREVIESGGVPAAELILTEGLLSEHDLPSSGPPCEGALCVRPAVAVAPRLATGKLDTWMHLGMTSGLPADFVRPPLDVVVAIDKSGSMSIDMEETEEAVTRLIDSLRPDDRIAVVAFDTELHFLRSLGPVAETAELKADVRALAALGGWDIQRAVEAAYAAIPSDPERLQRVMIFSCGYPSVSGSDAFSVVVKDGAARGIGMSFFGVLLGYSAGLAELLGTENGGAYYYLQDLDRVVQVFDQDFDTMVTPLAYDLHLSFEMDAGYQLAEAFGVPGAADGDTGIAIDVATAFLSRRRGGMVFRLDRDEAEASEDVGTVDLAYRAEPALGLPALEGQSVPIARPGDDEYYSSWGARKAVALVNMAEQLRAACAAYHAGDIEGAVATAGELSSYLAAEADALGDSALAAEVALVNKLIANMSS